MSTYREELNKLPDGYAELAIKRAGPLADDEFTGGVPSALSGAFIWDATPERHEFWSAVCEAYALESKYPPLPSTKESEAAA